MQQPLNGPLAQKIGTRLTVKFQLSAPIPPLRENPGKGLPEPRPPLIPDLVGNGRRIGRPGGWDARRDQRQQRIETGDRQESI